MTGLCSWYKEVIMEKRAEPPASKRRKKQLESYPDDPLHGGVEVNEAVDTAVAVSRPPIVMIIEDTEQFPPTVLQDLVASLS
eukprot:Em0009g1017a